MLLVNRNTGTHQHVNPSLLSVRATMTLEEKLSPQVYRGRPALHQPNRWNSSLSPSLLLRNNSHAIEYACRSFSSSFISRRYSIYCCGIINQIVRNLILWCTLSWILLLLLFDLLFIFNERNDYHVCSIVGIKLDIYFFVVWECLLFFNLLWTSYIMRSYELLIRFHKFFITFFDSFRVFITV